MSTVTIKNDADLKKAFNRLDEIWTSKPGEENWEERCVLLDQIEQYENLTVDISPPNPVDAILFRMEQSNLRNKDLVPYIGSAPKVSEILAGKRSLSKEMIRRLHEGLGIPLASLLGVNEDVPEGFVQVEWIFPVDIVESIANTAKNLGITENKYVERILSITVPVKEYAQDTLILTNNDQSLKISNYEISTTDNFNTDSELAA
jgi:HTH-type transcriptional regulator / antitoxin HigA